MSWELIIIILLVAQIVGAFLMIDAGKKKGYRNEAKIFAVCLFLGIYGYLYVLALPDKRIQD